MMLPDSAYITGGVLILDGGAWLEQRMFATD